MGGYDTFLPLSIVEVGKGGILGWNVKDMGSESVCS